MSLKNDFNSEVVNMEPSRLREFSQKLDLDPKMIRLTLGEPDFDVPNHIKKAVIDAIKKNYSHYPNYKGILPLRKAIAKYYTNKFDLPKYTYENVLCTVGSTEAAAATLKALFNPGDAIIIPMPTYPLYPALTEMNGLVPVKINTEKDNFILTPQKLKQTIKENPDLHFKGIIINDPSNPTGIVYSPAALQQLAKVIKKEKLWVISDEIYAELTYGVKHYSLSKWLPSQTIIINGLSKSHAMTGWRLGFALGPLNAMKQIDKSHLAMVTSPTSIIQYGGLEALTHGQNDADYMKKQYKKRRDFLQKKLTKIGFSVPKAQGAFYIFAKIPDYCNQNSDQFAENLAKRHHIGIMPGKPFGNNNYIRISYAASLANLKKAISGIEFFIKSISKSKG